jgi:hypothetical protein
MFDGQLFSQRARRVEDVHGAGAQICYHKKPMGIIPAKKAGDLCARRDPSPDPLVRSVVRVPVHLSVEDVGEGIKASPHVEGSYVYMSAGYPWCRWGVFD